MIIEKEAMTQNSLPKQTVILLTNSNSITARSIVNTIQQSNIIIEKVILVDQNLDYYINLFKFVSKRVGLFQTLIFSFIKLSSDLIHELFFCDLPNLITLLKEYKLPYMSIEATNDWQHIASKAIDTCNSRVILIGQTGILHKEFNLDRNDRIFLNCHPGKLPYYRGIDSFKWTILKQDWDSLASTIHIVRDKIDGGEIININKYNWRQLNWFFVDRELLILSGKHLVRYLTDISYGTILQFSLNHSKIQNNNSNLYYKMGILKEIKTLFLYLLKRYSPKISK